MKRFKLKSLDARGIAHFIAPLAIIVLVAAVGTYMLVASHADPVSKKSLPTTGTIKISAYTQGACIASQVEPSDCPLYLSKAHVIVAGFSTGATCLNINVHKGVDLGTNRAIKCTPGTYTVTLNNPNSIEKYKGNSKKHPKTIPAIRTIPVERGRTVTVSLGSYD